MTERASDAASALARDSVTPFIDRIAFMPPEHTDVKHRGRAIVISGVVTGIATFFVLTSNGGETGRRVVDAMAIAVQRAGPVTTALAVVLMYYVAVVVHELGHLLGGLLAGFRLVWIRVGPVMLTNDWRLRAYRGPARWLGGAVNMSPTTPESLARRALLLVAGGPLANLVTAAVLVIAVQSIDVWTGALFFYSIVLGLGSLVPMEMPAGTTDGARIGMLFDRPRGERWVALLALQGEMHAGVLPESHSREFLSRAIAVQDKSFDTVFAHLIAYSSAFYGGTRQEAERCLETCIRFSAACHASVREYLISEVTVFAGSYRRQPTLAEQWLATLPAKTHRPWVRTRAEAAVLEATGDRDGALAKLDLTEQLMLRDLPSEASTRANAVLMDRWRNRIADVGAGADDARHRVVRTALDC